MALNKSETGNLIQDLILRNKRDGVTAEQLVKNLDFTSYPYEKYGETVFAMKQSGWNVQLADISKEMHNGSRKGYEDVKDFAEYLAARMVLALALVKGKDNAQLAAMVRERENG